MFTNNEMANLVIDFTLIAIALIVSIILHEIAHGLVALANGDKTAKNAGRLSINPAKHFDATGLLMLLFLRVGYARPVPVNSGNFKRKRLGLFTVSIAGIVTNLILAFIFTLFFLLLNRLAPTSNVLLGLIIQLFYYLSYLNIFLAFFNLLPFYPLDGYNMLESIFGVRNRVVRFLHAYGTYMLLALLLLSVIVRMLGMPSWLNFLGVYLDLTGDFVHNGFVRFWTWIFGL